MHEADSTIILVDNSDKKTWNIWPFRIWWWQDIDYIGFQTSLLISLWIIFQLSCLLHTPVFSAHQSKSQERKFLRHATYKKCSEIQWNLSIADTIGSWKWCPPWRGVRYKEEHTLKGFHYLNLRFDVNKMLFVGYWLLEFESCVCLTFNIN